MTAAKKFTYKLGKNLLKELQDDVSEETLKDAFINAINSLPRQDLKKELKHDFNKHFMKLEKIMKTHKKTINKKVHSKNRLDEELVQSEKRGGIEVEEPKQRMIPKTDTASQFEWLPRVQKLLKQSGTFEAIQDTLQTLLDASEPDVTKCSHKANRAKKLGSEIRTFLSACHLKLSSSRLMNSSERFLHLLSALLSVYVDLCCVYCVKKVEKKKKYSNEVWSYVRYILHASPEGLLEVILQSASITKQNITFLYPALRQILLDQPAPSSHQHYLKHVLAVQKVVKPCNETNQLEMILHSKKLKPLEGFHEWLTGTCKRAMALLKLKESSYRKSTFTFHIIMNANDQMITMLQNSLCAASTKECDDGKSKEAVPMEVTESDLTDVQMEPCDALFFIDTNKADSKKSSQKSQKQKKLTKKGKLAKESQMATVKGSNSDIKATADTDDIEIIPSETDDQTEEAQQAEIAETYEIEESDNETEEVTTLIVQGSESETDSVNTAIDPNVSLKGDKADGNTKANVSDCVFFSESDVDTSADVQLKSVVHKIVKGSPFKTKSGSGSDSSQTKLSNTPSNRRKSGNEMDISKIKKVDKEIFFESVDLTSDKSGSDASESMDSDDCDVVETVKVKSKDKSTELDEDGPYKKVQKGRSLSDNISRGSSTPIPKGADRRASANDNVSSQNHQSDGSIVHSSHKKKMNKENVIGTPVSATKKRKNTDEKDTLLAESPVNGVDVTSSSKKKRRQDSQGDEDSATPGKPKPHSVKDDDGPMEESLKLSSTKKKNKHSSASKDEISTPGKKKKRPSADDELIQDCIDTTTMDVMSGKKKSKSDSQSDTDGGTPGKKKKKLSTDESTTPGKLKKRLSTVGDLFQESVDTTIEVTPQKLDPKSSQNDKEGLASGRKVKEQERVTPGIKSEKERVTPGKKTEKPSKMAKKHEELDQDNTFIVEESEDSGDDSIKDTIKKHSISTEESDSMSSQKRNRKASYSEDKYSTPNQRKGSDNKELNGSTRKEKLSKTPSTDKKKEDSRLDITFEKETRSSKTPNKDTIENNLSPKMKTKQSSITDYLNTSSSELKSDDSSINSDAVGTPKRIKKNSLSEDKKPPSSKEKIVNKDERYSLSPSKKVAKRISETKNTGVDVLLIDSESELTNDDENRQVQPSHVTVEVNDEENVIITKQKESGISANDENVDENKTEKTVICLSDSDESNGSTSLLDRSRGKSTRLQNKSIVIPSDESEADDAELPNIGMHLKQHSYTAVKLNSSSSTLKSPSASAKSVAEDVSIVEDTTTNSDVENANETVIDTFLKNNTSPLITNASKEKLNSPRRRTPRQNKTPMPQSRSSESKPKNDDSYKENIVDNATPSDKYTKLKSATPKLKKSNKKPEDNYKDGDVESMLNDIGAKLIDTEGGSDGESDHDINDKDKHNKTRTTGKSPRVTKADPVDIGQEIPETGDERNTNEAVKLGTQINDHDESTPRKSKRLLKSDVGDVSKDEVPVENQAIPTSEEFVQESVDNAGDMKTTRRTMRARKSIGVKDSKQDETNGDVSITTSKEIEHDKDAEENSESPKDNKGNAGEIEETSADKPGKDDRGTARRSLRARKPVLTGESDKDGDISMETKQTRQRSAKKVVHVTPIPESRGTRRNARSLNVYDFTSESDACESDTEKKHAGRRSVYFDKSQLEAIEEQTDRKRAMAKEKDVTQTPTSSKKRPRVLSASTSKKVTKKEETKPLRKRRLSGEFAGSGTGSVASETDSEVSFPHIKKNAPKKTPKGTESKASPKSTPKAKTPLTRTRTSLRQK